MDVVSDRPTVEEIAGLLARIREQSGRADSAERAAVLADKAALIARIEGAELTDQIVMPRRMREQAERTEAAARAGNVPPATVDDPDEIAARIEAGWPPAGPAEQTISRADAVRRLADHGFERAEAERMITRYLDETSEQVGVSVHRWGLDQHDVDAMLDLHRAEAAVPAPRNEGDDARRAELAAWHVTDQNADGQYPTLVRGEGHR